MAINKLGALLSVFALSTTVFASNTTYYVGMDVVQNDYDGALTNTSNQEAEQSRGYSVMAGAKYAVDGKSNLSISLERLELNNHDGVVSGQTLDDSLEEYTDLMTQYTRQINDTTSFNVSYKYYNTKNYNNAGSGHMRDLDYGGLGVGISHELEQGKVALGYSDLDNEGFKRDSVADGQNAYYIESIRSANLAFERELNNKTTLDVGYLHFLEDTEVDNNGDGTYYIGSDKFSGDAYYVAADYKLNNNTSIKPYYAVLNFDMRDADDSSNNKSGDANMFGVSLVHTFGDGTDRVMSNMSNKVLNHWIGVVNAQMSH